MYLKVASYARHGFTMSRRARISHRNHEHPITFWIKEFNLDKEMIKRMLIYVGIHHTGLYAKRTKFFRLPKLNDEKELRRFNIEFQKVSPGKKKFINFISNYLQMSIDRDALIANHQYRKK